MTKHDEIDAQTKDTQQRLRDEFELQRGIRMTEETKVGRMRQILNLHNAKIETIVMKWEE